MEIVLKRGGLTARVDTMGGELVSLRDAEGTEYIWGGDPAYWSGRCASAVSPIRWTAMASPGGWNLPWRSRETTVWRWN